jgi:hemerythrin-like domain-containing protein
MIKQTPDPRSMIHPPRPARADRRAVLLGATAWLGWAALGSEAEAEAEPKPKAKAKAKPGAGSDDDQADADIGPGEDLMREHGVLRRVLLIYDEVCRSLDGPAGGPVDVEAIQRGAKLVRSFVEDYHERQEEEFVFPRFERAGKLVDLVRTLRAQHQAGRKITDRVVGLATATNVKDPAQRRALRDQLRLFGGMYAPHAAREDTVLFPALHGLLGPHEYDALGDDFERREHQLFGGDGFGRAVSEVDAIERSLGIEDLARFTPRI